jgi:hypothetical protein
MSLIIKPHSPSFPRYDQNHSLAKGLIFATTPGGHQRTNLLNGDQGTLHASGSWSGRTEIGSALESASSTAGGAYWPSTPAVESIGPNHTVLVWANVITSAKDSNLLCVPSRNGSWTTPFAGIRLARRNDTNGRFTKDVGGVNDAVESDAGFIDSNDGFNLYGATAEGQTVTFYRNGFQHGGTKSYASAGAPEFIETTTVNLMNRSDSSPAEGLIGSCPMALIWNRVLTQREIYQVYLDPWGLIKVSRHPFARVPVILSNPKGPLGHPLHGPFGGPIS